TQFLSKREGYKENPIDYIYNAINDMITKSKATGIEFVVSRLVFSQKELNFAKIKESIQKIKSILQGTDILIHNNYNEAIILFPATPKEEVDTLITGFIPNISHMTVNYSSVNYPKDGDTVDALFSKLYKEGVR
ncbi:MAG: hypothetical protein JW827_02490, partial [Spirochaetes bacterium]|nr:hypothetical protein [Spirochaetota bacterium]